MTIAFNADHLKAQLERHEVRRLFPYVDTAGKITIGIGYNLTDNGLTNAMVDLLYNLSVSQAVADLDNTFDWFSPLDEVRQRALIDLRFNLGMVGLQGFHQCLGCCSRAEWGAAAAALLDSDAARALPTRYQELAAMLRTGRDVV